MTIRISSDSTLDLSPELIDRYEVSVVSLTVSKDGKYYKDMLEILPDEIFAHVAAGGDLCTTSAANVADYIEHFTELRKTCDAVIHVNLSADFSACYRNACLAAEEVDGVYVVDSRNLSTGHGHVVLQAAEQAEAGRDVQTILTHLEQIVPRVRASFLLEQLTYMRKGGRCSSVAALGANLLKLKPCIAVQDGRMGVTKKYRGTMVKCLQEYVHDQLTTSGPIRRNRIFITHSGVPEETIRAVKEAVEAEMSFEEIVITRAGCTVSCHCGPGTLGILFIVE